MDILIGDNLEIISHEAARLFMSLSRRYIRLSGRFVVAVSGGRTPERLYRILSSDAYRKSIAWGKIHMFWVDERFVPYDHPDNNFRLIRRTLLKRLALPWGNLHPITTDQVSASASAKRYDADVRHFFSHTATTSFPRFDLIILGIGADGHTASLFPGSKRLNEEEHIAVPVKNGKTQNPRVTLTLPVLNNARHVLFLVSGKRKAPAVRKVIIERDRTAPASLVNPHDGKCHYYIDRDAATAIR